MAETTELVTLEQKDAMRVFTTENGVQPFLDKIRKHIDAFSGDAVTKEGRAEIKSMAYKVSQSKTYLEGFGKACADEVKEIPRKIDRNRKLMKDTLDAWRDEVRKPLTEWEAADEARIKMHVAAIENLRRVVDEQKNPDGSPMTLDQMRSSLMVANAFKPDIMAQQEFAVEYEHMNARLANVLRKAIPEREQAERDAAELAELRRHKEEREAKEAAENAAREAEERKRLEAEAALKEAADLEAAAARAELEAAQRREREAMIAAEQAERRAAETEARIKREQEEEKRRAAEDQAKREANKRHRANIHKEAVDALCGKGIDVTSAGRAIDLIASGRVPHVTIEY